MTDFNDILEFQHLKLPNKPYTQILEILIKKYALDLNQFDDRYEF